MKCFLSLIPIVNGSGVTMLLDTQIMQTFLA
jgi:hypothetical protein